MGAAFAQAFAATETGEVADSAVAALAGTVGTQTRAAVTGATAEYAPEVFEPATLPDYGATGAINIDTIKTADVYALWDALVAANPTYLTQTTLGPDQSGSFDLRQIVFNNPVTTGPKTEFFIVANLHGHEPNGDAKIPAILAYELVKNMLAKNLTHAGLRAFFDQCTLQIVPIGNPWGFDSNTRGNSRHVDLNRNFDADWAAATVTNSLSYKGESAASEAETKLIQAAMVASSADAVIDIHCWGLQEREDPLPVRGPPPQQRHPGRHRLRHLVRLPRPQVRAHGERQRHRRRRPTQDLRG